MTESQIVQTLGGALKKKREELNMTLQEAEKGTSIRIHYLKAIEEGNISNMISPVFAQGFLRQYASFLGEDGDSLIKEHKQHFQKAQKQDFAYGIGTLETRGHPGAGIKWIPNVFLLMGFVLALVAGWYLARYLDVV